MQAVSTATRSPSDGKIGRVGHPAALGLLAAAWRNPRHRAAVLGSLSVDHFVGADRTLYRALEEEPFDYLSIEGKLDAAALARVIEMQAVTLGQPSDALVARWITTLRYERSRATFGAALADSIAALSKGAKIGEVLDKLVSVVADENIAGVSTVTAAAAVELARADLDNALKGDPWTNAVPTGFRGVDRNLGGLRRGHVTVIGALQQRGKTQLALQILRNVIAWSQSRQLDNACVMFSAEMPEAEIIMRLAQAESGVALHSIKTGRIPGATIAESTPVEQRHIDAYKAALDHIAQQLGDRLVICPDAAPSTALMARIVSLEAARRKDGIGLIVFDYLQLAGDGRGAENETVRVGTIMRGLKRLAKTYNAPVLVLAQLNRSVEMTTERMPQMYHLRQSGEIEHLAEAVLLIDMPMLYKSASGYPAQAIEERARRYDKAGGNAALVIGKNRNGGQPGRGMIMRFEPACTRWADIDYPDDGKGKLLQTKGDFD